jgi:hypothetical protein
MLSITYVMVRSAEGASRTTHGGRAAPGFRFATNSFTRSFAGATRKEKPGTICLVHKSRIPGVSAAAWLPYLV